MSGNAKFRWFLLAPALLCFLSACASTGTLDNTSSTLQTNTSREVKLEGEDQAKCEWEREYRKGPGEVKMECNDYSGEPRVQGYELCPPGWHDKFVASSEMRKIQRGIDAVAREKKSSIENQEFEKAAELRDKEEELRANLEKEKDNWEGDNGEVYSEGESRNKNFGTMSIDTSLDPVEIRNFYHYPPPPVSSKNNHNEQVRSGICVHNNTADFVKNMIAEGVTFYQFNALTEPRECKAGQGCRRAIRCAQCRWDLENVYWADAYGEGASWYPCDMC